MKYTFIIALIFTVATSLNAQTLEKVKDRTGRTMLKGFVSDSLLATDTTNFAWFKEQAAPYEPAEKIIKSFSNKKDSVAFFAFFGTWCPDSHYVIPRFFKIIDKAGLNKKQVSLFALDRTKKDANHFAENFNISHVPTIIVLKNGKETGRVVEYGPSGRFDEELAAILDAL